MSEDTNAFTIADKGGPTKGSRDGYDHVVEKGDALMFAGSPHAKVRAKGQVTIPAQVRKDLRLAEDDPLYFVKTEEGYLLRRGVVVDALQAQEVITLSARDSRAFMAALRAPRPASARLRQAAEQYKAAMGDQ